ncbi:MAG: NfeD family protein [Clostridia bacterium]|nr:NfeD family protein [Clostridia bacterium]
MWKIWLILAGIFFICEIATTGFLIFWLSIGSLFAMIVSIFIPDIIFQTAVFVIASTILIFLTKPFVKKFDKDDMVPTNVYSLTGKKGIVIEEINTTLGKGQVKVHGEVWSAVCDEDTLIPVDSEVEIISIKGVKAYVKPIKIHAEKN